MDKLRNKKVPPRAEKGSYTKLSISFEYNFQCCRGFGPGIGENSGIWPTHIIIIICRNSRLIRQIRFFSGAKQTFQANVSHISLHLRYSIDILEKFLQLQIIFSMILRKRKDYNVQVLLHPILNFGAILLPKLHIAYKYSRWRKCLSQKKNSNITSLSLYTNLAYNRRSKFEHLAAF